MRKLALMVGTSILLVTGGTFAGAQEPAVHAGVDQTAIARWNVREAGQRVIYFAAAFNHVNQDAGWPSIGYAGRAECREVDRGHHTYVICRGRAKPVDLMPGDFVMDPALQSARLSVTTEGVQHTVSWEATGETPQPYLHQHAGTDVGFQVMTGSSRRALASGTLFGQEFTPRKGAIMMQGAIVDVYLNGRQGGFQFRDGTLIFRQVFRK